MQIPSFVNLTIRQLGWFKDVTFASYDHRATTNSPLIEVMTDLTIEEANTDGNAEGLVNLGDLTALIDYLFITFTPPAECL